jgi:hypothetical protein
LAFGPLGLKPDEFWKLTPNEIFEMAEGYQERVDTQMHLLAWHAANIMNIHLKKKVTVNKLLGKEKKMSQVEIDKEIDKALHLVKKRRESSDHGSDNSNFISKNRR